MCVCARVYVCVRKGRAGELKLCSASQGGQKQVQVEALEPEDGQRKEKPDWGKETQRGRWEDSEEEAGPSQAPGWARDARSVMPLGWEVGRVPLLRALSQRRL